MNTKNILLLSSGRFLMSNAQVFHKPFKDLRMAYVITAAKGVTNTDYIERTRNFFKEHGYNYEEIDLDGKNQTQLRETLQKFEIVFVEGGNSFYLLKSIRESGFDIVIRELLQKGLIYMGASAGSYVACPSIEMAIWKHQDKYKHYEVTDFSAMNLVPFLMTVHYKPEYDDILKEKIAGARLPVKILTDQQALLIKNDEIHLIGDGEKIDLHV